MDKMIRLLASSQFLRYVLVGGTAFVADLLSYYVFHNALGLGYLSATTAAFVVGAAVNYLLSVRVVFSVRVVSNRQLEFLIFFLIGVAGAGLNALFIYAVLGRLGLPYLLAKIVSAAALLMFNYQVRKVVLFTAKDPLGPTTIQGSQP